MLKPIRNCAAVLFSSAIISQTIAPGAHTAQASVPSNNKSATAAVFTLESLGSVALRSHVSVKLTDMDILVQPSGNILIYTLSYNNGTGSNVALIDYFSKVTTPGGTEVQGKPVTRDAAIKTVPAKSSQTVTYYVNIGKAAKVNGVKVSIFGFDFSSANYQKRLGVFTIPTHYSTIVPEGQSRKMMVDDLPVTAKAESLQKIQMNGKVYLKAGISLANSGTKALSDPGYKAYLKSSGGSVFDLKLDDASSSYAVQPQEKKMIYYLAEVPSYLKTENMILQLAQEDPTLKVNLPIQSFSLPAVTVLDSAVPIYAVKNIFIGKNAVETQLKSTSVYPENDFAKWSLKFRMKNLGNKSVTLPAYELVVKTAEGYSIPVDAKAFANVTLKPLEEKIFDLSVDVPLKLNQDRLQLHLSEPPAPDKVIFPTARYMIPYSLENSGKLGIENLFENSHGTFAVKLDSFQRLPWQDGDQMAAKISIRNTSSHAVQMPKLKALVKAGMSDLSGSAHLVAPNGLTALAPNESAEMYVLAGVPYSYSFNQLRIILQESSGDEVTTFISLNTNALNNVMNNVDAGGSFHIDIPGKKAEVRERRTTVYSDSGSNVIYTELEMVNGESRQSKPAQLVAYYKTSDNQYYEAKVSQSPNSIGPNGKSLVTVWSKLPQSVNTSELMLYIGAGVADGKLTDLGGTSTGYINTVGLSLNATPIKPSNLNSLDLFPYNLSIVNAVSTITEGKDTLDTVIHYNLSKNEEYETGTYEHKLVLELIDPYGESMEKTLALGTDWTIGNGKSYEMSFNNKLRKIYGGTIRINLYDEFQGRRILLGSQAYPITYVKAPNDANQQ